MYYEFKNERQVIFNKFLNNFNIQDESYSPKSIMSIADSLDLSRRNVEYYVQNEYPNEYKEIWARGSDWFVTKDIKEKIIRDILDFKNRLSLNQIGKKYGFNISTIARISKQDVEPYNKKYSHELRFPQDIHQRIGTQVHSIASKIITQHFLDNNIQIFSAIPRKNTNYIYDQIIPNIQRQKLIDFLTNESSKKILNEISLSLIDLNAFRDIIFEYTSFVGKKHTLNKIKKYYSPDNLLFIVITRWHPSYKEPVIYIQKFNTIVIRHDYFASLFRLQGELLDQFNHIIDLNYKYDLEELIKLNFHSKFSTLNCQDYKKFLE